MNTLDTTYFVGNPDKRAWISLSDVGTELTWTWSDASDNTYQPWNIAPNFDVNINCAFMSPVNSKWYAHDCADRTAVPLCAKKNQ